MPAETKHELETGRVLRAGLLASRRRIGPHRIIAPLGEGVLGDAYLVALDGAPGPSERAVLKQVRPALLEQGDFERSLLAEVQRARALQHPHIARMYGACRDGKKLYLAMEYVDGQPWSMTRVALWADASAPLRVQLQVLADVLEGLHYAHELGVTHGGLNPRNVYRTRAGQVKLVNFRVACAMAALTKPLAHDVTADLAYLAPEQLQGEPIDRRTDVFSVGVMLWESLMGRPLASGQRAEFSALDELSDQLPIGLVELCVRALAVSPDQRFASADEFREGLVQLLETPIVVEDPGELAPLEDVRVWTEPEPIPGSARRALERVSAGVAAWVLLVRTRAVPWRGRSAIALLALLALFALGRVVSLSLDRSGTAVPGHASALPEPSSQGLKGLRESAATPKPSFSAPSPSSPESARVNAQPASGESRESLPTGEKPPRSPVTRSRARMISARHAAASPSKARDIYVDDPY
jgi:serine/threonine-protein kinase